MTEPGTGSDLKGIRTRAVKQGDHYIVDGGKTFITNGWLAGLLMLVVRTDPEDRSRGLSILMVETKDLPGYRVGRVLDKMGLHGQDTSELFFEGVKVPVDCLLGGEEGKGMHQLMHDLPYERTVIAVGAVGAMEGGVEETLKYVRERKTFGQPVWNYQNTRFKLAELASVTRVARVFSDRCIVDLVAKKLDTETASMAKYWITDMQQKVLDECVQLHGGYGYMNEYLVCRLFADSRVQRIYGGTNEIMKEVIARGSVGPGGSRTMPKDVDSYITAFPMDVQARLKNVRRTIRAAAPKATEVISYNIPAYRQNGMLVYFAGFKNHIGLYPPVRGNVALERAVARYAGPKGNLKFSHDEPLPLGLIARIVRHRVRQDGAKAAAKKKRK